MSQPVIATQADYYVPLMRVLADFPNGEATSQEAIRNFYKHYSSYIDADHLTALGGMSHEDKWENYVRWARKGLKDLGYLEMPRKGIWRISDEGRNWLAANPNAWHLDNRAHRPHRQHKSGIEMTRSPAGAPPLAGLSFEMLEQTRKAMGDEQFRPVWGAIYDQLMAAERAKAITEVHDSDLTKSARRQVRQIQDYLQGRNGDRPNSEQICDWIHFCYQFSLFREAAALFTLVNADEVNSWYLERTRKIAAASRARL